MIGSDAYIAANRFGLGANGWDMAVIASDPHAWLRQQLTILQPLSPHLSGLEAAATNLLKFYAAQQNGAAEIQTLFQTTYREIYFREVIARTQAMMGSESPFRERLVMFWSNHFTVSATQPIVAGLAGAFEREAIRPHVTGRFADMLVAATKHPAMILYLDNALSIGPNSRAGRFLNRGLNENLAREILELHTLGVDAGYGQHDVLALAKLITGWSLARPGRQPIFIPAEEGEAALHALARHPATAHHIARKFARHFVADEPAEALVRDLTAIFTESDGDLSALAEAVIDRPEAWHEPHAKYKTPYEFALSVLRATGFSGNPRRLAGSFNELGQLPFRTPSPAGWQDVATAWAGPEAVVRRAEWSLAVAHRVAGSAQPLRLLDTTLGPLASVRTRQAVESAESPARGVALLFASPEFQRR